MNGDIKEIESIRVVLRKFNLAANLAVYSKLFLQRMKCECHDTKLD